MSRPTVWTHLPMIGLWRALFVVVVVSTRGVILVVLQVMFPEYGSVGAGRSSV